MRTCECGREIRPKYNTTIYPKYCPACTLKNAVKTKRAYFRGTGYDKGERSKKSLAMARADKYFSRYIRLRDAIVKDGIVITKDIISGKYYRVTSLDCGHYIPRGKMATRYHEDNCYPQNRSSNRFKGESDKDKFRENIIKLMGEQVLAEVEATSRETIDTSVQYFNDIAEKYKKLSNDIEKQLGVRSFSSKSKKVKDEQEDS